MALIVSNLDKTIHDRSDFDCGESKLNEFLKIRAARHQAQRISRTFVLTDDAKPKNILGYYTLSNSQIARAQISEAEARALPRYPIPAVLLARMAVDRRQQGKHYGQSLLMDAIKRSVLVGQQSGVYALLVDAKNQAAKRFYGRFGFAAIIGHPLTLYLPLETGLRALQAAGH